MALTAQTASTPPNFSFQFIDLEDIITIETKQQMIVCDIICIEGELCIEDRSSLVLL